MTHDFQTLGLDPGLRALGLTVVVRRGQSSRIISTQTVRPKSSWPDAVRFEAIGHAIAGLARGVDLIVVEGQRQTWIGKSKTGKTNSDALKLQEIVGIARGIALSASRPFLVVEPNEVRASLGVPPKADKAALQRAVRGQCSLGEILPTSRVSQHAWDAAAIAVAGERRWRVTRRVA